MEENGKNYWFIEREDMEEEIRKNNFLEYGEHNGHLYGTHLDSVRDVIKQGILLGIWINEFVLLDPAHNNQNNRLMDFR